jgi:lysophospholipase L1-like esterase
VRTAIQNAIVAVTATVVACAAVELGVRAFALAPPLPPRYTDYVPDDVLPFRLAPNTVRRNRPWPSGDEFEFEFRTNSQGSRDVEHAFEKPPGVFRILGLGDSYTAGAGAPFEASYLHLLEEKLRTRHPVEIIKAGQPRYWTEPERLLLETIGVRYHPDLVIVAVTPNDVTDTYLGVGAVKVRDGYLVSREAWELGRAGVWLYVHSQAARMVLRAWLDRTPPSMGRGTLQSMRPRSVYEPDGYHEPDWRAVEGELDRILAIVHHVDARLVVVHIPTQDFRQPGVEYVARRLAEWGRRNDVPVIDTLPALRAASEHEAVYWTRDIHCTPAGYRVIAETLFAELTQRGLVP